VFVAAPTGVLMDTGVLESGSLWSVVRVWEA
jgi:hypothetical protein